MLHSILNYFKTDCRYLVRDPILLVAFLYPLIAIILLRFAIHPVSDWILLKTGFRLDLFYTIIAITLISAIPALLGFIYAYIYLDKSGSYKLRVDSFTPADKKNFLYFRLFVTASISFILVLITTLLTDPVPSEGWLRSVFVSVLLSLQSPFVFLYISGFASNRVISIALLKLYIVFLATVPFGLLLHRPWNYFAFFSPLYWISWAWVTAIPRESLLYGAISMIITFIYILILFRHLLRKYTVTFIS